MLRATPLLENEVYHVFNRGAHKARVFNSDSDYKRFLLLLHISNNSERIHLGNLLQKYPGPSSMEIFDLPTDKALVDVLSYTLMPNHFHLVLRQKAEGGITTFMKKVLTGYSMYFNLKNDHGGVVFQGRFKSQHIEKDEVFRYIFAYVHLNPVEFFLPDWKKGNFNKARVKDLKTFMQKYKYSSYYDYYVNTRPERSLLSMEAAPTALQKQNDIDDLVADLSSRTVLDEFGDRLKLL